MPSRRQFQTRLTDAEQRKRRQEKFRKRKKSMFRKVRLLAKDTDAWVALIVRDRAGQIQSFASSDSPYWPPSRKDLLKKYLSGTHEFLKKRVISGCWKEVAEDESDSALVDSDIDSFVGDIRDARVTSIKTETGSNSTTTTADKEINVVASSLEDSIIEAAKLQKSAIEALSELESISVAEARDMNCASVNGSIESDYINVDAPGELDDIDSTSKSCDAKINSDREADSTAIGEPDAINLDVGGELNATTRGSPIESEVETFYVLGDSDNRIDAQQEFMLIGVLNKLEVDPKTSKYNTMDLNIPEAESRAEIETTLAKSTEAANDLHTRRTTGDLGRWEVINWPRTTRQGSQKDWNSITSTRIDPKELLQGWNWIFQRQ